ncbi:hypothetical protein M407DRAFT_227632 [Tulasnella calospora MUT 4182]|uniref:F-box domain-containing protein n=1 Tax=Tulasnella calospora MUT 4182 TaxID=1051891 RepID=A0A0C3L6L0_9AGAM|nr:hypothetical protein M407DRAFT_227632 [Tulasnella calospora MUT 4182]
MSNNSLSMNDIPDEVLIEVFTSLDFPAVIALRLTCRRFYAISKSLAVWLGAFRWISQDAEEWRSQLENIPQQSRSAEQLEKLVTRMVRFERNWSSTRPTPQRIAYFEGTQGNRTALLPGGRWFLATTMDKSGRVLCYDFEAQEIAPKTLLECPLGDRDVWAMAFAVDQTASPLEFDLALEFANQDQFFVASKEPRVMSVWRVRSDGPDGTLSAKVMRIFPVYRRTPVQQPLSLSGDWLLRLSYGQSYSPILTVHRWRGHQEGSIADFILLPQAGCEPLENVSLLPDLRIITVSHSRVELYAPATHPWKPSPIIPPTLPRSSPTWVFEYPPPHRLLQLSVSRLVYGRKKTAAMFALHNGETLFNFRIALTPASTTNDDSSKPPTDLPEPQVTSVSLRPMTGLEFMCLGSSHTIRSSANTNAAIFATFPQHSRLRALRWFSGVRDEPDKLVGTPARAVKSKFVAPFESGAGRWMVDEQSGRVVCMTKERQWAVLYFA